MGFDNGRYTMKRIHKYPFTIEDDVIVHLPLNAQIISIQLQGDIPCVWAVVNPLEEYIETKQFKVFGTGHPMPDTILRTHEFRSTLQLSNGLVFHVFEKKFSSAEYFKMEGRKA
jgi:hypothetical protein